MKILTKLWIPASFPFCFYLCKQPPHAFYIGLTGCMFIVAVFINLMTR